MLNTSRRLRALAGAVPLTALALTSVLPGGPADAATHAPHRAMPTLHTHTILSGKTHGWTKPDDLAHLGRHLFVGFQNGVPSTGGAAGTPQKSTLVEFRASGRIERHVNLVGKIDGMGADPAHRRVIVTVNEDGNSSLYTVGVNGAVRHYTFNRSPLPHGGGTDSVTVRGGRIYLTASAPSSTNVAAVYQVALSGHTARIVKAPFRDDSMARVANAGQTGRRRLALTDPDSSTSVPGTASRFRGMYMLDSQGDQQAIFVKRLGIAGQVLHLLNLSQSVDDTAFPTRAGGALLATDSSTDSVVLITGPLRSGAAYTSITPEGSNNAPANPAPNHLGVINLRTGHVSPVATLGLPLEPKGLIYLP